MIWYPSHLSKSVFAHFWIGLLCSLPRGEKLPRAICFAHIKAQSKPTANWNTKHKPSCFPLTLLVSTWAIGKMLVPWLFGSCSGCQTLPLVISGIAHDVGPIPKPVLFVCFSVWLILIDFVWEMKCVTFAFCLALGKLWNHPSLGISIRTNSSIYDT